MPLMSGFRPLGAFHGERALSVVRVHTCACTDRTSLLAGGHVWPEGLHERLSERTCLVTRLHVHLSCACARLATGMCNV